MKAKIRIACGVLGDGYKFDLTLNDDSFWGGSGKWSTPAGTLSKNAGVWEHVDYLKEVFGHLRDKTLGDMWEGFWSDEALAKQSNANYMFSLSGLPAWPPKAGAKGSAFLMPLSAGGVASKGFAKWECLSAS